MTVTWEDLWSSAQFHMRIAEHGGPVTNRTLMGLHTVGRGGCLGSVEDGLLNGPRRATRAGRPDGYGAFVTTIEMLIGQDPRNRRRLRPRKRTL